MTQRVLQYIEIDIDYCSLTYSVPPCQARLETDGDASTSDTLLLLHADTNSPAGIVDASVYARAATMNGNATGSTSQSVYGGASLSLDGTGDFVTFLDSPDWDFGTSDFTIDWWERRTAAGAGKTAVARDATTAFAPFVLGYDDGAGGLDVFITSDGANWNIANARNLGTFTVNVWSHRAVVRSGSNFYLFKDGVLTDSFTSSSAIFANANPLSIGRTQSSGDFAGFMDEVRITRRAIWTAAFTPPTRAIAAATGTIKCFNSLVTCQDRANFTNAPVTLRFAVPTADLPLSIECIPSISDIRFEPSVVSLGENLGQRATLTVTFNDHRHSDTGAGFDKYISSRPYNPYEQGTFWGKFRSRQTFLRGRAMRWINGFTDQALADMETRHYIIDSFTGPDSAGKFQIIAKDILKLADGDRAKAPNVSNGFLVTDIAANATSLTLSPSGIGDAEYAPTGYVAIGGSEIVFFIREGYTKLIMHLDGTDGATTTTDDTNFWGATFSFVGNAQLDTAQKKFGASSLLLDGTGDYVLVTGSTADFNFGSEDFSIEFFFRLNTTGTQKILWDQRPTGGNGFYPLIYVSSGNVLKYFTNSADRITGATVLTTGVWYHCSLCRGAGNTRLFLDGSQQGSTFVDSGGYANGASRPAIGTDGNSLGATPHNGWIDEIIVKKGLAMRTANFTPPAAPYAMDFSGDIMSISRAQLNTTASAHSAQDRVQTVLQYISQGPEDIIADLLENYAGVDPSYIPISTWHTEIESFLNRVYSANIAQPTSVAMLISELIEQAGLSMWWDDRNQEIGLLVLRGLVYTTDLFNEENTIADSLNITEQPDKRLSQVHTYFGQINSLTSLTDKANYRSVSRVIDAQAESDYGSAAIKEIFSRWIPALGRTVADRLGTILLSRFTAPPRHFKFSFLRNSVTEILLARGYQLQSWLLQQDTGASDTINIQVTRLRPSADILEVESDEVIFSAPAEDLNVRNIIVDADINNINLRTVHDSLYQDPVSGNTVILTVAAGVIVGSNSYALPSIDVGSWPAGVIIVINIAGDVRGAGGSAGASAQNGGTGIYTRFAIKLAMSGKLYGGGGAGGISGQGGTFYFNGGGGAGRIPGLGGTYGSGGYYGANGGLDAGGAGFHPFGGGGDGGGPGLAGVDGTEFGFGHGAGGAAGMSIDGISFTTTGSWDGTTFTPGALGGDLRGPTAN